MLKRLRNSILLIVALGWVVPDLYAQFHERDVERQLEFRLLMNMLDETLSEVPFNMQRIVFLRLEHNAERFSEDQITYIRDEIERVFAARPGITMLSVPELEVSPVLHITSSDTSLIVKNLSPFSATSNPEDLMRIGQKYAIQGYLSGRIQYSEAIGYQLNLRLIRPESREVTWNKTIETRTFEPEPERIEARRTIIAVGAGLQSTQNYLIQGISYGGKFLTMNYAGSITFRQPMTANNSGYIGLTGGLSFISLLNRDDDGSFTEFSKLIPSAGVTFFKTFLPRMEEPVDHWLEVYLGANMFFPSGNDNLFSVNQGFYLNLSDNLGVAVDLQYLLMDTPHIGDEETNTRLNLNNLGYGLRFLFRL